MTITRNTAIAAPWQERDYLARTDGYIKAGGENEGSTEKHIESGLLAPDQIRDQYAGDELCVVVLRHVGGRSVLHCDIEAERAESAEEPHGDEPCGESNRQGRRVHKGHECK